MYMTLRSGMCLIMDLVGPELSELSALELKNSVPNLATIYMPIKSRMSSILGQIESEHPELFALEFGKIAESDFVYTLASTNIDQSIPSLVKMYVTIRLRMSLIMDFIRPGLVLIKLEFVLN